MIDTVTACIDSFEVVNSSGFETDQRTKDGLTKKDIIFKNLPSLRLEVNNLSSEFYFRASLPHHLYGASIFEVQEGDVGRAVEVLKDKMQQAGIKTTESAISQARVHRVDFCKNLTVDHSCMDYISLLDNFRMPRRDKLDYNLETLTFGLHSKNKQTCIYNKVRQGNKAKDIQERAFYTGRPENVLRYEFREMNNRTILKEVGRPLCFYSAFNSELSRAQILRDFNRIKDAEECQISLNFSEDVELYRGLISMYGNRAFEAMLGIKGSAENVLRSFCYQYKAIVEFFKSAGLSVSSAYKNTDKLFEYNRLKPLTENRGLIDELKLKLAA